MVVGLQSSKILHSLKGFSSQRPSTPLILAAFTLSRNPTCRIVMAEAEARSEAVPKLAVTSPRGSIAVQSKTEIAERPKLNGTPSYSSIAPPGSKITGKQEHCSELKASQLRIELTREQT